MRRLAYLILPLCLAVGACDNPSSTRVYILKRNVKAGEAFTRSLVDEVGFSAPGDAHEDLGWVTHKTINQYLGQYFTRDLPQYSPVTPAVLDPNAPNQPLQLTSDARDK